jgi:hypothetical protein
MGKTYIVFFLGNDGLFEKIILFKKGHRKIIRKPANKKKAAQEKAWGRHCTGAGGNTKKGLRGL